MLSPREEALLRENLRVAGLELDSCEATALPYRETTWHRPCPLCESVSPEWSPTEPEAEAWLEEEAPSSATKRCRPKALETSQESLRTPRGAGLFFDPIGGCFWQESLRHLVSEHHIVPSVAECCFYRFVRNYDLELDSSNGMIRKVLGLESATKLPPSGV